MNNKYILAVFVCVSCLICGSIFSKGSKVTKATVTYLSAEYVYIDVGSNSGITVGDTLTVERRGVTIAKVIIKNVANNSAACVIIAGKSKVKVGDRVPLLNKKGKGNKTTDYEPSEKSKPAWSKPRTTTKNRLKGNISIQNYWLKDMTGSRLSSNQPSLRTRVKIENLAGSGLTLQVKHRSRAYYRSRSFTAGSDQDEWIHKVYEFAVYSEREGASVGWALGRILSPYVRGMGYLDGGYFTKKINSHYRFGVVAGIEPDAQNTEIRLHRRKFGAFVTYEKGSYATRHLMLTAALSTSYENRAVNREFVYFQSSYSHNSWASLYQSVEIDINRNWRKDAADKRFSITNFYSTLNFRIMQRASVFFSYDARKNIRYLETRDYPDSLFDDGIHRGFKGGFSLRLFSYVRMNGHAGIRLRQGELSNNRFASLALAVSRFPFRRHSVSFRMSWIETMFTTGYQPYLIYRFPVKPRLMLTVSGAGYIYKTGSNVTRNYSIDMSTYYSFVSDYYISASLRQYFDKELQSIQVFMEFGLKL